MSQSLSALSVHACCYRQGLSLQMFHSLVRLDAIIKLCMLHLQYGVRAVVGCAVQLLAAD